MERVQNAKMEVENHHQCAISSLYIARVYSILFFFLERALGESLLRKKNCQVHCLILPFSFLFEGDNHFLVDGITRYTRVLFIDFPFDGPFNGNSITNGVDVVIENRRERKRERERGANLE